MDCVSHRPPHTRSSMGTERDDLKRSRRDSYEELPSAPRSPGHRSIHDRLGGRKNSITEKKSPQKRTDSNEDDNPNKRRRLSSNNVKPSEDDPKLLQRSRRMFGALMGHLGRAKKELAQDSDLLLKQDRLLNAAEEKEKRMQLLAQDRASRRRVEGQITAAKREASDKIAKLERKHALSKNSERHQARYLQTVTPIPIFYLPAQHTKETQALVDASMEAIEEKIQQQRREIDSKRREIEKEAKRKIDVLETELAEMEKKSSLTPEEKLDAEKEEISVTADQEEEKSDTIEENEEQTHENETQSDIQEDSPTNETLEPSEPVETIATIPVETLATIPIEPKDESVEEIAIKYEHDEDIKEEDIKEEDIKEEEAVVQTKPQGKTIIPSKLKVVELRKQLKNRGLDTKGLKDELIKRLEEAMAT